MDLQIYVKKQHAVQVFNASRIIAQIRHANLCLFQEMKQSVIGLRLVIEQDQLIYVLESVAPIINHVSQTIV